MAERTAEHIEFPALRDTRYPIHKAADRLEPYLRTIVERIHPERVILFGSYAYGQPEWDSDFDLLVIRAGIDNWTESNIEIREALREVDAPRPSFTFLSRTPEEFDAQVESGDFLSCDIAKRGLVLYAAPENQSK